MNKIKTIFKRNWDGNRGVIDKYISDVTPEILKYDSGIVATEKVDGTNIRLTVRNKQVVRIEKRRNPTKTQKQQYIIDPWYVDVDEYSPADKYIVEAVRTRTYDNTPDGEWSGEVYGKNIQGNPLNIDHNSVYMFSCNEAVVIEDCPTTYNELKEWLPKQKSQVGNGNIEGIVWHCPKGVMYKIKCKDFK